MVVQWLRLYFHSKGREFDPSSLVVQTVQKNLPAKQEIQVHFLGQENTLEKGMATHSRVLAWRILMDGGTWWAAVYGVTQSQT